MITKVKTKNVWMEATVIQGVLGGMCQISGECSLC
jgi:hypothetical protein